jgi:broad specificity phosphatase PhoE
LQKEFPETRNIIFVRHLESKYNEYKQLIKQDSIYIEFIQEQNREKKEQLAQKLLSNFFETVGIDYETDLSSVGHKQGEKIGKLYAKLIQQHPELFPDIIYVSPYLRTRLTANYLLKNIEGLKMNLDQLTKEEQLQDLIIGKFYEKEFVLKIDERIRERDHGLNVSPSFLREFQQEKH